MMQFDRQKHSPPRNFDWKLRLANPSNQHPANDPDITILSNTGSTLEVPLQPLPSPVNSTASGPSDFTENMEKYFAPGFDINSYKTRKSQKQSMKQQLVTAEATAKGNKKSNKSTPAEETSICPITQQQAQAKANYSDLIEKLVNESHNRLSSAGSSHHSHLNSHSSRPTSSSHTSESQTATVQSHGKHEQKLDSKNEHHTITSSQTSQSYRQPSVEDATGSDLSEKSPAWSSQHHLMRVQESYDEELLNLDLEKEIAKEQGRLQTPPRQVQKAQGVNPKKPTTIPAESLQKSSPHKVALERLKDAIARTKPIVAPLAPPSESFNPSLTGLGSSRRAPSEVASEIPFEAPSDLEDTNFDPKASVVHHNTRPSTPDYLRHVATQVTLTLNEPPEPAMLPRTQSILNQIEDLQTQVESYKTELDTLKQDNYELHERLGNVQQDNNELHERLDNVQQDKQLLEKENKKLRIKLVSFKEQVKEQTRDQMKVEEEQHLLMAENKQLKEHMKEQGREQTKIEEEQHVLRIENKKLRAGLKSPKRSQDDHLQKENNALKAALETMKVEYRTVKAELSNTSDELACLKEKMRALQDERNLMGEALMYEWGKQEVGPKRRPDGTWGMGYRYKYVKRGKDT